MASSCSLYLLLFRQEHDHLCRGDQACSAQSQSISKHRLRRGFGEEGTILNGILSLERPPGGPRAVFPVTVSYPTPRSHGASRQ